MKPITQLRNLIIKDYSTIPDFIDTKAKKSNIIWCEIQNCFQHISRLTTTNILPNDIIEVVKSEIDNSMLIINTENPQTFQNLLIADYIETKVKEYLEFAIEEELFEVANNIQNFMNLYNEL